jgi:hypothetical protein
MSTHVWSERLLDGLRDRTDPEADEFFKRFVHGQAFDDPRYWIHLVARNIHVTQEERVEALRPWFDVRPGAAAGTPDAGDDRIALPAWADPERIRRGQDFFLSWGLQIATALFCASLPVAYAAAKGAHVIRMTGELVTSTNRRLGQTGRFLWDVMGLDEDEGPEFDHPLRPGTRAWRSARGVRLQHAAVRHFVTHDAVAGQRWQERWGAPINQEDLLGTLLTFTTTVFDALDRLGCDFEQEAAEDYLHTWNVIGWLLGIDSDLLDLEWDEAYELEALLRPRNRQHSKAGVELTEALLGAMAKTLPWPLDFLPAVLVRRLAGDEIADLLRVPAGHLGALALVPAEMADEALSRVLPFSLVREPVDWMTRRIVKSFID